MKNIFFLGSIVALLFSLSDCGNGEEPAVETNPTAEITVKNGSGSTEVNLNVYVFDQPSTEPNGSTPSAALKSSVTDENGIAKFDLKSISVTESEKKIYFTVLEESLDGNTTVLGTLEATLLKNESVDIKKDLVITDRSLKYKNGFIPATISSSLARNEYNRWKSTQRVVCGDDYRMIADPSNETRVEAIGFGMLLSAYANDKTTFDGLFNFYKSKRTTEAKNMMGWLVTCNGIIDPGSATDGDIDVAFSLIIADKQWGETYLESAKEIIQIISDNLIVDCTVDGQDVKVLAPGYSSGLWGGCGLTDIQYYTPAYFRIFADISGNAVWDQLADDTYILLNASANGATGLVPDWQSASGTPGPSGRVGYFGYDACRVPWRIALDYLWNGNAEAKVWCSKVSNWANGIGTANLVDGYELDGTPKGQNGLNSAFLGGFSVAAMTNSPEIVNNFADELSWLNDSYWFNLNTRVVYLFALTGNFRDPS